MEKLLEQSEWAGPAAEKASQEPPHNDQKAHGSKGKDMEGTELGDDADGAGKGCQRAGITVEYRSTKTVSTESHRIQPHQQESRHRRR